jgi:hypothetical protein
VASGSRSIQNYSGAVELLRTDGELLGVVTASIEDLDAPVWSAESRDPINLERVDPGGETVTVRLGNGAHPRSGQVATAHLELRNEVIRLAGNYGFHGPDD